MEFKKIWKNIINKKNRKAGVRAYYDRGEVYLSKLFGYMQRDGKYVADPKHVSALKCIFAMLADGKSLPEVKRACDLQGYRDGSQNKYCIARIIALVRPVYAGYLQRGIKLVQIKNLEPIITLEVYKAAYKQIRKEKEKILNIK